MTDYSEGALTLEERAVKLLIQNGWTITTAESCTGGLLSGRLVNVSGVSSCLKQAYVTYCDEAKKEILGVSEQTLQQYTAVSEQTAAQMASGGANAAGADICLSVTGVAGPSDEGEQFPAGLVYIGCFFQGKTTVLRRRFSGGRMQVRAQAVDEALKLLISVLEDTTMDKRG